MPGALHQGILQLFHDDPWLAFDLLGVARERCGRPVDRRAEVEVPRADFERRLLLPDLVLIAEPSHDHETGMVITVEAQSRPDPKKRWRIPHYQAALGARSATQRGSSRRIFRRWRGPKAPLWLPHCKVSGRRHRRKGQARCRDELLSGLLADEHERATWVVIVSLSAAVSRVLATWAQSGPPRFEALVLDADSLSPEPDLAKARSRPCAAVLVAALHACRGDLDAARWGLEVLSPLPPSVRLRYATIILAAVDKSMRIQLIQEYALAPDDDRLLDIERRSGTYLFGRREGREEGEQSGRRAVLVEMILALLEVRGLAPSANQHRQIRAQTHLPTLRRWATDAREAASVALLLSGSPVPSETPP